MQRHHDRTGDENQLPLICGAVVTIGKSEGRVQFRSALEILAATRCRASRADLRDQSARVG